MHRAIRAAVRPGHVVVDMGTGAGTYVVMAVRAGASKVYAVEPDRIAEVASEVFRVNGVEDRVDLIRCTIEELELPEKADLLITEDFAPWFYEERLHDLLLYDRNRILKEKGDIIPARIRLRCAPWGEPVPEMEADLSPVKGSVSGWRCRAGVPGLDLDNIEGIDFTPLEQLSLNTPDPGGVPAGGLLAQGEDLFEWDLRSLESRSYTASAEWVAEREGEVCGLGVWMEMIMWPGIEYSNSPSSGETSWGQGHFPLTPPLVVQKGTLLTGKVAARTDPSGVVWWSWELQIKGQSSTRRESNTFRALPLGTLRRKHLVETGRLPLSRWAMVDAFLLGELEKKNLQDAAESALEEFPDLLLDTARARRRAASVRERYLEDDLLTGLEETE